MIVTRRARACGLAVFAALLVLTAACAFPQTVYAQGEGRTVRVGWYESPFNTTDEFGRRSGYAYEYQQKIAAYTGWTYEYVEASGPDLMQMLVDGKIDLLSDVSYTEERAKNVLFSSLSMGAEDYYIFVTTDNEQITLEDPTTLDGKKVGVNKGSVQADYFREWADANGVHPQIEELTSLDTDNFSKLRKGMIDAYVSIDAFGAQEGIEPLCKIGSSDFYFAVRKGEEDLLTELNAAMYRIQDTDEYYNQYLASKYFKASDINHFLSTDEEDWLGDHTVIRVGYQDNYLAFCAADPKTGELVGALRDYLDVASECLDNMRIEFEPIAYPTASAALEALKAGEVDCMFPANLTDYDGEVQGFFMTAPVMGTDMSAVVREEDQQSFSKKEHVRVAVNAGNPNYDMFLLDHFPTWRSVYFKNTKECLKAISEDKADCLLISNYRYNDISDLCERYGLVAISTGVEMDYCLAVNRGDTALYSILNKIAGEIPESTINAALAYNFAQHAKSGLLSTLGRNPVAVAVTLVAGALAIACAVFFCLWRKGRGEACALS